MPTSLSDVVPSPSTVAPPSSSSPAAETILTDVASPTEVSTAGEQVVFDEASAGSSNQEESDSGVTTDMPARSAEEMQMDDAVTTITPEMVMEEVAQAVNLPAGDAPSAISSDDDTPAATTPATSS